VANRNKQFCFHQLETRMKTHDHYLKRSKISLNQTAKSVNVTNTKKQLSSSHSLPLRQHSTFNADPDLVKCVTFWRLIVTRRQSNANSSKPRYFQHTLTGIFEIRFILKRKWLINLQKIESI
jgi:hypothetical protein